MKKCPFCAEEIQDEAIKCKHCGEWLEEKSAPPPELIKTKQIEPSTANKPKIASARKQCQKCGSWDIRRNFLQGADFCYVCKEVIEQREHISEVQNEEAPKSINAQVDIRKAKWVYWVLFIIGIFLHFAYDFAHLSNLGHTTSIKYIIGTLLGMSVVTIFGIALSILIASPLVAMTITQSNKYYTLVNMSIALYIGLFIGWATEIGPH